MPEIPLNQAMQIAIAHHEAGRLADAEQIYRQILAQFPRHADALHLLGVLAGQSGQFTTAVDLINQAIAINPRSDSYYTNLGNALEQLGRRDEAIAAFNRALELNPQSFQAQYNLANSLSNAGRIEEAIAAYSKTIELNGDFADAHFNLGIALADNGHPDEAVAANRRAIALKPDYSEAHNNLGIVLCRKGQFDEASTSFRQAIAVMPDYAEAHYNLALALFAKGNFPQGWAEQEWRWKIKDPPSPPRNFTQAQWDGSPLRGRTVLLHAEQGFGDTLQFIRYLPMVIQLGGQVIVECPTELKRLLQMMAGAFPVVATGSELPHFDLQCPLLSLPHVLGTTLESIPGKVPYIDADAGDSEKWREHLKKMGSDSAGLKVGLAWAGNPKYARDRTRSLSLDRLAPLGQAPGLTFYSLQKGEAAAQAAQPPDGMRFIDLSADLHDFADTAAAMNAMDLVITTDTSIAHLAGAMGRPVWVMLQFVPDWRWMLARQDSPWYPTMRLFRQSAFGDWDSVMREVSDALFKLATAGKKISHHE